MNSMDIRKQSNLIGSTLTNQFEKPDLKTLPIELQKHCPIPKPLKN